MGDKKVDASSSNDLIPDVIDGSTKGPSIRQEFPVEFEATSVTVQRNDRGNLRVAGRNWSSVDPDKNGQGKIFKL